jgi:tetratricopeptide (TPR) repeat protein
LGADEKNRAPHQFASLAILCAIVWVAYSNSFPAGFTFDNRPVILEDPRLRQVTGANLELIFQKDYWWPMSEGRLYRPITTLTYLLNYAGFGNADRPAGYHWFNFLLHAGNVVLAYFLVLGLTRRPWPAVFAAAVFGLHPVNTECVTNIVGRADLLAGAAVLGGLLLHMRDPAGKGGSPAWHTAALGVVALAGMLSKENAAVLLPAMALYDLVFRRDAWRRTVWRYLAVAAALAAWFALRQAVSAHWGPQVLPFPDNPVSRAGFWSGRLTAIKVIALQLALLVWPRTLSCDYSYNQIPLVSWGDWQGWLALTVVLGLLTLLWSRRSQRAVFFFGLFGFTALLPTSNLVVIIGSIMAERFLYLPSLGFAACLSLGLFAVLRHRAAVYLLLALAAELGARTWMRNLDWADEERLWTSAVAACPASFKTHQSLAYAWYEKGRHEADIDRIIAEGEKAVRIVDDLPPDRSNAVPYIHLGSYYLIKSNLAAGAPEREAWRRRARDILLRGVRVDRALSEERRRRELARGRPPEEFRPAGRPELYQTLAVASVALREYGPAVDAYLHWRRLRPQDPRAYSGLADAYLGMGDAERAAISLIQSLALGPSPKDQQKLVEIYRRSDSGCALVPSGLNLDCPQVKRDVCAAYEGLSRILLEAHRPEKTAELRAIATGRFGCPP